MTEELLSISQVYAKGKENLEEMGYKRYFPPDSRIGASIEANRKYLDSFFFQPKSVRFFRSPVGRTISRCFRDLGRRFRSRMTRPSSSFSGWSSLLVLSFI